MATLHSKKLKVHLIKEWRAFSIAIQFLTTLPVVVRRPTVTGPSENNSFQFKPKLQGRSFIWYPAVGLVLGVLLTMLIALLPLPFYLTAAIVIAFWVVLTGGLHLDGLADCADAWMAGLGDREKTLRVMKDPLCGAMGVLSLTLILLIKVAALAAVITLGHWVWLWAIPLLSRLSLLLLFLTTPYVRPQGLGDVLARHFPKSLAKTVVLVISLVLFLILPFPIWLIWLVAVLLVYGAVRSMAMKRLQGITGDVAGAEVELVEAALLIAVCFISIG